MQKNTSNQKFKLIALLTFLVYFISVFFGHINLLLASCFGKIYFPLRSYVLCFNDNQVTSLKKSLYNLAGHKAIISTDIPYKLIDDLFFILISIALIVLFIVGYKLVKSNKIHQTEVMKWSLIFAFLMAIAIPSHSSDLYGYIARGAQQTLYNHNPYFQAVNSIEAYNQKPLFLNFMWTHQPTTYGPIFVHITKLIVFLSNNNFLMSFVNFKLLNLTVFLLIVLFTLKLKSAESTYLIAWNPFILIQGLWNSHIDLLSGAFIFFGLYSILSSKNKNKLFWGMFCLTVATGIKYVAILAIPFVFLHLLKSKKEKGSMLNAILGLISGIIFISIFTIEYLPYEISHNKFEKLLLNVSLVHKSLIDTISTTVKYFCSWQNMDFSLHSFQYYLKLGFYSMFLMFYAYLFSKKKTKLLNDITLVLFIFISFTIAKFHSWYLLNFIMLLPLLTEGLLKKILIALSMSHVFAITFLDQAKILNFTTMTLLPVLYVLFTERKIKHLDLKR